MINRVFRFIVIFISIILMSTGCSKEILTKESLITVETKAYIEKEIPLDKGMKRVVDLKINNNEQLEAIICDEGIFAHWILDGGKWVKTDDRRFEGLYAKNSIVYLTYDKDDILYVLFKNEEDMNKLYAIEEGQKPKAIPIEFEHTANIDNSIYGIDVLSNGDIVIGYGETLVCYDGQTYKEKEEFQAEYNRFSASGEEVLYIDKSNNLQSIPMNKEKKMIPITIPEGQLHLMVTQS